MIELSSMTKEELARWVKEEGWPAFRARQIFSWIHAKCAGDFSEMTDLSKDMRSRLEKTAVLSSPHLEICQTSKLDQTRKYLFSLPAQPGLLDGKAVTVESVLMKYDYGWSVCISSQVGCRMGCTFCASTLGGRVRDLTAGEMASQIYAISRDIGERISHVVVMGMGEPLENDASLVRFLDLISDEDGYGLSLRHITVSTCGLADKMRELADRKLPITLALSLHAPNQEIRARMMPIARKYDYDEVLAACAYYFEQTGRRITFEYALAKGVNDSPDQARELAKRLKAMKLADGRRVPCHVNLIPINPVTERDYHASETAGIRRFFSILEKEGLAVTIRREMGRDIDGACGQLRQRAANPQR